MGRECERQGGWIKGWSGSAWRVASALPVPGTLSVFQGHGRPAGRPSGNVDGRVFFRMYFTGNNVAFYLARLEAEP